MSQHFTGLSATTALLLATSPLNAQEASKEALADLSARKNTEFLNNKANTEARAKRQKLPLVINSPSGQARLHSFLNDLPLYRKSMNLNAAKTVSTDDVWPGGSAGYSLTGAGSTIGIWDGGAVLTTHQEFVSGGVSRVTIKDIPLGYSNHATHVAGTMIAQGLVSDAKGMAYGATLDSYDWENDVSEMAASTVKISNHSYGYISGWEWDGSTYHWYGDPALGEDPKFGLYMAISRDFDGVAYAAPTRTIVQSAGNDRFDGPASQPISHYEYPGGVQTLVSTVRTLDGANSSGYDTLSGGASCAKNVITVGAVLDIPAGYSTTSDVQMTSFSSWGPTDDGRIKPDIVANGYELLSPVAVATNTYAYFSGTSMASPNVAGSLALVNSHMGPLFSPGFPRSATTKAVVIHSANESGPNPGPDYMFGWGLMNTPGALALIDIDTANGGDFNVRELGLASTDTLEFPIVLASGTPVRSTLVWTDPPGTIPAYSLDPTTAILKNDLNLSLVGTSTYYPWSLDPANPANAATATGPNTRDNVERIDVTSPTSGPYIARVTGSPTALTNGGQSFSLTLTGATRASNFWTAITHPTSTLVPSVSCEYFDSAGNRYIASATTDSPSRVRISKFDSGNSFVWSTIWYVSSPTLPSAPGVIRADSSGNVVLAAHANNDLYVVKFNSSGVWQWQNSYDRANLAEFPRDMEINSVGDVFVTGVTQQSSGYTGWITIKYLANGTRDWDKFLGPSSGKYDFPSALAVDSSGNCFVTGKFKATTSDCYFGDGEAVTVKYTANGTKDWERQNTTDDFSFGADVQVDSSGNVYVLTAARTTASTLWDFQTIKYNTSGTAQWTNRMSTSGYTYAYPRSLILGPSSDLYITGYWAAATSGQPSGSERLITAKYSTSTGSNTWTSNLTYQLYLPDSYYFTEKLRDTMRRDSAGNLYIAGTFHNGTDLDVGYVKLNSSGTYVTERTYGTGSGQNNYQISGPDIETDGNVHLLSKTGGTCTAISIYQ